jgi:mRNA interferase HigB
VRVISQRALERFWQRHPDARDPLRAWFKAALAARWQNLGDVRKVYSHADGVKTATTGTLTVFNICGNKCRLVTRIKYEWQLVNIRRVLTHAEYDKSNWKE